MNAKSVIPPKMTHEHLTAGVAARFVQVAIGLIIEVAILFLAAGRLDWVWAWVFLALYLVDMAINSAFLLRINPETIAERGHGLKGMRDWDKTVSILWSLAQYMVLPIVAGLDVRFGWTHQLNTTWHILGAIVFSVGLAVFGWAMISNVHISTAVRFQSERGHTVCRTGPYRFMRHPGYVGAYLQSLAAPFLLGSLWALIPGIVAVIALILRTSLEDRTLQTELPGYRDYVRDVRYRLIPGIW